MIASAAGERSPARKSVERRAHGAPGPRGIIGGVIAVIIDVIIHARGIEAERVERMFQAFQMLGERPASGERPERFEHPLEGRTRPFDSGQTRLEFAALSAIGGRYLDRASQLVDMKPKTIHQRMRARVDIADLVEHARKIRRQSRPDAANGTTRRATRA